MKFLPKEAILVFSDTEKQTTAETNVSWISFSDIDNRNEHGESRLAQNSHLSSLLLLLRTY